MDKPTKQFIVVFDDAASIVCPMGPDPDCSGALESFRGSVAVFDSRQAARRAIRISAAQARLRKEQGLPVNDDFLPDGLRCIHIVPLVRGC